MSEVAAGCLGHSIFIEPCWIRESHMHIAFRFALVLAGLTACAKNPHAAAPAPAPAEAPAAAPAHPAPAPTAAPAHNPEADREIARLRARVQDRDAQIVELQRRLSEAMNE